MTFLLPSTSCLLKLPGFRDNGNKNDRNLHIELTKPVIPGRAGSALFILVHFFSVFWGKNEIVTQHSLLL